VNRVVFICSNFNSGCDLWNRGIPSPGRIRILVIIIFSEKLNYFSKPENVIESYPLNQLH